MRLVAVGLLAAALPFLSACGGSSTHSEAAETCTVYQRDTALSVTFATSDASRDCDAWIRVRGQEGSFWSRAGSPTEAQSVACIFRHEDGGRVEVDDGGSQIFAQQVCASFAGANGWKQDIQAEADVKARAQRA